MTTTWSSKFPRISDSWASRHYSHFTVNERTTNRQTSDSQFSGFINDNSVIKVHSIHLVFGWIIIPLVIIHFFVLHIILSSDNYDRGILYLEYSMFTYWLLLRDITCMMIVLQLITYTTLIAWDFVFHEESFQMAVPTRTSDKVIPEWFFLFLFGCVKSVPDKGCGVFLLLVVLMLFFVFCWNVVCFGLFVLVKCSFVCFVYFVLVMILLFLLSLYSIWVSIVFPVSFGLCFVFWFLLGLFSGFFLNI